MIEPYEIAAKLQKITARDVDCDVLWPSAKIKIDGWEIGFFLDAGVIDYVDFVRSDDQRFVTFDDLWPNCPLDLLSSDIKEELQHIIDAHS